MARVKVAPASTTQKKMRPALDPEARQNQMISLAEDLVMQRLQDGTASSQETTHYLKLATAESRYKNQLLEAQVELAKAKKEAIEAQRRSDEMFEKAIKAFRNYSGQGDPDEY